MGAHTVQVKVRYGDFTTLTRQITVEDPLTEAGDIYRLGCFLLGREKLVSRPLRLLGLGVASLREPSRRTVGPVVTGQNSHDERSRDLVCSPCQQSARPAEAPGEAPSKQ